MEKLLEMREGFRKWYSSSGVYVDFAAKALLAFAALFMMARAFPGEDVFSNLFLIIPAAVLAGIVPIAALPVIAAAFLVGHAFCVGTDAGVYALVICAALYGIFLHNVRKDPAAVVLTPVFEGLGVPAAAPVALGLRQNVSAALSICAGCFAYSFADKLGANKEAIAAIPENEYITRAGLIFGDALKDPKLIVTLLACLAAFALTTGIQKSGINFAPAIGIVLGCAVYAVFCIFGNFAADAGFNVFAVIIGAVAAGVIAGIYAFLEFPTDFARTQLLEFEDDDFRYYVKAVPRLHSYSELKNIKKVSDKKVSDKKAPDKKAADKKPKDGTKGA